MRLVNKRWNKRAESDSAGDDIGAEGPSAIIYIPAVVIVFIVFFYVVLNFVQIENVYPTNVKSFLETQKFFSNPECFAYTDPVTGRTLSYTLDLDKFNEIKLDRCYNYSSTSAAYKITLYDSSSARNKLRDTIYTPNWGSDPPSMKQSFTVRVINNKETIQGLVELEIQI